MKTAFEIQKNGKVATTCFAHPEKKIIVPANYTGYGFNLRYNEMPVSDLNEFHRMFGFNLKTSWSKGRNIKPSYSEATLKSIGFVVVKRGDQPLF